MRDRYLRALASWFNCDPAVVDQTAVTVAGHVSRAASDAASGYALGEHFVVSCDPALVQMLTTATAGMAPTMHAWAQRAQEVGGEFAGCARMQVLPGDLPPIPLLPPGFDQRSLNATDTDDLALIARLIDHSDGGDIAEAEIDLDKLNEVIEVVVDASGEIACFSTARAFAPAPDFADIGIMTRANHRHKGVGSTLVAALCTRLRSEGLEPLYCCAEDNTSSIKLAAGLGFEIATQLSAYRFASPNL